MKMERTNSFCELSQNELTELEGGFVITGAMIIKGIGVLAAGIAFGEVVGETAKGIYNYFK